MCSPALGVYTKRLQEHQKTLLKILENMKKIRRKISYERTVLQGPAAKHRDHLRADAPQDVHANVKLSRNPVFLASREAAACFLIPSSRRIVRFGCRTCVRVSATPSKAAAEEDRNIYGANLRGLRHVVHVGHQTCAAEHELEHMYTSHDTR